MHSDFTSLAILLLGRATLATWPTEIKRALQEIAANTIRADGNSTDGWIEAGDEFLISPMAIDSPNLM